MQVLNPDLDLERFHRDVRSARHRVLLLDYDGTLAPFHRLPERALPYPEVAEILNKAVERGSTRVIVVSGRRFADLRVALARIRHSEVWAAHGWERRTAEGERVDYAPASEARRQLQLAETPARRLEMHGVRVEPKVASVAVHWRGVPQAAVPGLRDRLRRVWDDMSHDQLEMLEFEGGMELRVRGRNKGDAVKEVLAESGPGTVCAYLGDDYTDEDAFAAIKNRGLAVLVRPELRETLADLWLVPPRELIEFLRRWCEPDAAR